MQKKRKGRVLKVFEVKNQSFVCVYGPGVYKRDSRRRDLFYASVSEKSVHFGRRGKPFDTMLQMVSYNAIGEVACHHLA